MLCLFLALFLLPPPPAAGVQADGAQWLKRLAEAARRNRGQSEKFIFQEDTVRYREVRSTRQTFYNRTYEVTFLEGENYYKLVAENGEPLSIDDAMQEQDRFLRAEQYRKRTPLEVRRREAAKEERNRLRFDLESLALTHTAKVAGRDVIGGHEVVVLDVAPAGKPRKPRNRNLWTRILAGRLWLDTSTGHPVKAEMRQLIDWDMQPKGNLTSFNWLWMEGAWLISLIRNVEPLDGGGAMVIEQRYSSYSRFQADIKLTYQDIP
ncbi:MAG: hypothetical protein IH602_07065 [Bryobacteraceae bacterium]|nr:hypothetical protein [Bryobacteraceae bacterium]